MPNRQTYEPRLAKAAARSFGKLSSAEQTRVRQALQKTAATLARPGSRGGKSLKQIRGRRDAFYRLRVGDLRIMFDVIESQRTLLVLGIVHRSDLDRWLRSN